MSEALQKAIQEEALTRLFATLLMETQEWGEVEAWPYEARVASYTGQEGIRRIYLRAGVGPGVQEFEIVVKTAPVGTIDASEGFA